VRRFTESIKALHHCSGSKEEGEEGENVPLRRSMRRKTVQSQIKMINCISLCQSEDFFMQDTTALIPPNGQLNAPCYEIQL
jgi:hypothetical protein